MDEPKEIWKQSPCCKANVKIKLTFTPGAIWVYHCALCGKVL